MLAVLPIVTWKYRRGGGRVGLIPPAPPEYSFGSAGLPSNRCVVAPLVCTHPWPGVSSNFLDVPQEYVTGIGSPTASVPLRLLLDPRSRRGGWATSPVDVNRRSHLYHSTFDFFAWVPATPRASAAAPVFDVRLSRVGTYYPEGLSGGPRFRVRPTHPRFPLRRRRRLREVAWVTVG